MRWQKRSIFSHSFARVSWYLNAKQTTPKLIVSIRLFTYLITKKKGGLWITKSTICCRSIRMSFDTPQNNKPREVYLSYVNMGHHTVLITKSVIYSKVITVIPTISLSLSLSLSNIILPMRHYLCLSISISFFIHLFISIHSSILFNIYTCLLIPFLSTPYLIISLFPIVYSWPYVK